MTFATLVNSWVTLFDSTVVPLLYALAFLYFVFGVARYAFLEGDEGRKKAKDAIIYGLIGLVVIFGVWGIVNLVLATVQL
jgi:hypothetical protein